MTRRQKNSESKPEKETVEYLCRLEAHVLSAGLRIYVTPLMKNLRHALKTCADGPMAVRHLMRFIETDFQSTPILTDLARFPVLVDILVSIFSHSQFFADILVRNPELFRWLTATNVLEKQKQKHEMLAEARQAVGIFRTQEKKINALKRFQRREMLRIGVRDLIGTADLETTTLELSNLADAVVSITADLVRNELSEKFGAVPVSPWAILGLGKLGGMELNYSSDIDIIAIFDMDGPLGGKENVNMTNGEYFTRFIERIINVLTSITEEGYFYRVDARLRPDGASGAVIRSYASTMMYYESRGELWERQMLIKARCIAGDEAFARRFLHALTPFIYPRTQLSDPLQEISDIKMQIESKSRDQENIKLRAGGIRDIEFIVQALQMLNGGKISAIRSSNTLHSLHLLQEHSLLSEREARVLKNAYRFFRMIEHRLQILQYAQTHTLPAAKLERTTLARRLGMTEKKFEQQLTKSLSGVRKIYDGIFAESSREPGTSVEKVLIADGTGNTVDEFCHRYRLQNKREVLKFLRRLVYGTTLPGLKEYTGHTRTHFLAVADSLFDEIGKTPDPDRALANCEKILNRFPSIDSLYTMLEEKDFRHALVTLGGYSGMLSRICSAQPEITEMFMTRLTEILEGIPEPAPVSGGEYRWKLRSEVRAAVRYLLGGMDEELLFRTLSGIADRIIDILYLSEKKRINVPSTIEFCVLGLGKSGGEEINFGADLDLVFLYRGKKKSDGGRIENLASSIMERCARVTPEGTLYEIDARLRPEGKNAPLAVAAEAYLEYLQNRASLWERQSLTRIRCVAGDKKFADEMIGHINRFIYDSPLPRGWKDEILRMRRKTETRNRTSISPAADIKVGAGGLMDIEFTVQALQLHAGASACRSANMYRLLDHYSTGKGQYDGIPILKENYRQLRRVEAMLRIGLDLRANKIPVSGDDAGYLAALLGDGSAGTMIQRITAMMKQNRKIFEQSISVLC
jgi:glutamate-ammonia-ligase adenylyltransferase